MNIPHRINGDPRRYRPQVGRTGDIGLTSGEVVKTKENKQKGEQKKHIS